MTEAELPQKVEMEEFKFQEDEDDQIDLLNPNGLADLKNALFKSN